MINIRARVDLLENMHQVIRSLNDERAYESWILFIPDEPSRDDFRGIAEDENDFEHAQSLFTSLVL